MVDMKPSLNVGALSELHTALLRRAESEANDERVRESWRLSEEREHARRRAETRQAWAGHYRNLEASFAAHAERCGAKARRLEAQ